MAKDLSGCRALSSNSSTSLEASSHPKDMSIASVPAHHKGDLSQQPSETLVRDQIDQLPPPLPSSPYLDPSYPVVGKTLPPIALASVVSRMDQGAMSQGPFAPHQQASSHLTHHHPFSASSPYPSPVLPLSGTPIVSYCTLDDSAILPPIAASHAIIPPRPLLDPSEQAFFDNFLNDIMLGTDDQLGSTSEDVSDGSSTLVEGTSSLNGANDESNLRHAETHYHPPGASPITCISNPFLLPCAELLFPELFGTQASSSSSSSFDVSTITLIHDDGLASHSTSMRSSSFDQHILSSSVQNNSIRATLSPNLSQKRTGPDFSPSKEPRSTNKNRTAPVVNRPGRRSDKALVSSSLHLPAAKRARKSSSSATLSPSSSEPEPSDVNPYLPNRSALSPRQNGLNLIKASILLDISNPRQLLTTEEKRANHIRSEKRRRAIVREEFDTLVSLIPGIASNHSLSKSTVLDMAVEFIHSLEAENEALEAKLSGERR